MGVLYFRKSVGEPYVISKKMLEEISGSAAVKKYKETGENIIKKGAGQ